MNKKIFKTLLIAIFVLILISAWFLWRNTYSRDVLKLEILASSQVEAGDRVNYVIQYKNNGNVRLEEPKLIFDFPENTIIDDSLRETEEDRISLRGERRVEIKLDNIHPGEEKTETLTGYLFGKQDSILEAKATIYFSPRNLNVQYSAETTHSTQVTSVPINFDLYLPSRVDSEKEFSFDINYFSKIDYPLSNLRIKIEYPREFSFSRARPEVSYEESEWELGVLNRGEGGRVEVFGKLKGDPSDIRSFKASLGFWQNNRFVVLKESTRGVEIATPLLYITHRINKETEYIASPGEYLEYEIFFRNTGEEALEDLFLTARINRGVVDFDRVQIDSGTFQKNTGTIIWDSRDIPELEVLASKKEGRVSFWIKVEDYIEKEDPEIEVDVSLSQSKKRIVSKVNSKISFSQKAFFSSGPFDNYGSQPPSVGSSTSYTLLWKIDNSSNRVRNMTAKTRLPSQVRLSGETEPKDARITFDSGSRELIWNVGDMDPKTSKEVYFQLIFDPQIDDRGELREIISETIISGLDSWTGMTLRTSDSAIKTDLPDDDSIDDGIIR